VYHYEFPDSLETYYQEAGGAGRDGERARAVLLYRSDDGRIKRFFLLSRYPKLEDCRSVLNAATERATVAQIAERAGLARRRVQVVVQLLREAGLLKRSGREYQAVSPSYTEDELLQAELAIPRSVPWIGSGSTTSCATPSPESEADSESRPF
jgi:ATP-dependent DNA helicase RecQ